MALSPGAKVQPNLSTLRQCRLQFDVQRARTNPTRFIGHSTALPLCAQQQPGGQDETVALDRVEQTDATPRVSV
jgi:hypothetical protein